MLCLSVSVALFESFDLLDEQTQSSAMLHPGLYAVAISDGFSDDDLYISKTMLSTKVTILKNQLRSLPLIHINYTRQYQGPFGVFILSPPRIVDLVNSSFADRNDIQISVGPGFNIGDYSKIPSDDQ
jgi:hypothetical protein